jgi:hypothetical protein
MVRREGEREKGRKSDGRKSFVKGTLARPQARFGFCARRHDGDHVPSSVSHLSG